jgi:hypothetical protein
MAAATPMSRLGPDGHACVAFLYPRKVATQTGPDLLLRRLDTAADLVLDRRSSCRTGLVGSDRPGRPAADRTRS